jgi:hypothetical protein
MLCMAESRSFTAHVRHMTVTLIVPASAKEQSLRTSFPADAAVALNSTMWHHSTNTPRKHTKETIAARISMP